MGMKDFCNPEEQIYTPLQQHQNYAAMLAILGRACESITLPSGSVALIQSRSFAAFGTLRMVTAGPNHPTTASPHERLKDIERLRDARVQIINPVSPDDHVMQAAGYRMIMTPAHDAVLDIALPAHERHAAMHGKWRNRLRSAQPARLNISIRPYVSETDLWLLSTEAKQRRSLRYRGWPTTLTRSFAKSNPAATWIAVASSKNKPVAAMLFLGHEPSITYHLSWANTQGRALNAQNLLLDEAASYFAKLGHSQMNLGLIETEQASGLARFKLGTGAKVRKLGGTWLRLPGFRRLPLA
jgi:hypothetical protein